MTDLHPHTQFQAVALEGVETKLDQLWHEVNERALAAGGTPVSRNTVLTLAALTSSAEQAQRALNTVDELASQHPARAIVVLAEPEQQRSEIDVGVAIHTQGEGAQAVYGEEILVDACGDAARHIPGAVLPLMITGLPAILWWNGEPPWGSMLVETLVDGSDRLIVDSSDAADTDRFLISAADLVRRKHAHCTLTDLNWARQTPWREMTAQFFDPPALRPFLGGVDRVTVEYAAGDEDDPANAVPAYLYAGWLAARLNWTLPTTQRRGFGPSRQHTLHDAAGRPVLVEIAARYAISTGSWHTIHQRAGTVSEDGHDGSHDGRAPVSAPAGPVVGPGALMSVRIHAALNRRPGTFIIARDEDLEHATTLCQVDEGAPPSRTVHLGSLGEMTFLSSQLEQLGRDTIFEDALHTAARLVGADGRAR
jgi:glucose-6-phosphate dehydrogenase assembly protein OpcA